MAYKKNKEEFEKKDYRQELTDKVAVKIDSIIAELENPESKNLEWNKTWFSSNQRPVNPATGTIYKGINVVSLLSADFVDHRFYTFNNIAELEKIRAKNVFDTKAWSDKLDNKQITYAEFDKKMEEINKSWLDLENKGLMNRDEPIHVIKGSKAMPVFKAIEMSYTNDKNNEGNSESSEISENSQSNTKMWVQAFAGNVFNASQINNIKPLQEHKLDFIPHDEVELHLKAMIEKTDLKYFEEPQGRAFYRPSNHSITMPERETFNTVNDFYGTLLHEIGHSTGKELGRDLGGSFGTKSYAFEELVADISSNLMSSDLGIPYDASQHENHLAYLKSWSKALKEDKNLIFKAASKAEQSVNYQHNIRNEYKQELGLHNELENDLKQLSKPLVSTKPKMAQTMHR